MASIHRVGQAVSVAVGRFVAVGEAIASENQELKDEMGHACFEARRAGRNAVSWSCLTFLLNVVFKMALGRVGKNKIQSFSLDNTIYFCCKLKRFISGIFW